MIAPAVAAVAEAAAAAVVVAAAAVVAVAAAAAVVTSAVVTSAVAARMEAELGFANLLTSLCWAAESKLVEEDSCLVGMPWWCCPTGSGTWWSCWSFPVALPVVLAAAVVATA